MSFQEELPLWDPSGDQVGSTPPAHDRVIASLPHLLTATEVADVLRVPRSTVYELAREQRIPYLKVGRRTLFEVRALAEWIASRTVARRR